MTTERSYNIPLRKGFINTPRWCRTKKAVSVLREFLIRHTKREDVRIGLLLNEHIWKHGGKNPPHHVKVDVWIEADYANAELSGHTYKEAVKVKKKEEPTTLKDKLAAKLEKRGSKDEKEQNKKDEKKKGDKKTDEKEKKEDKTEENTEINADAAESEMAKEEKAEKPKKAAKPKTETPRKAVKKEVKKEE